MVLNVNERLRLSYNKPSLTSYKLKYLLCFLFSFQNSSGTVHDKPFNIS